MDRRHLIGQFLGESVLLSGLAFVLSSFRPMPVLKGRFRGGSRGVVFRNVLVGIQFGLSVILLICTGIAFEEEQRFCFSYR